VAAQEKIPPEEFVFETALCIVKIFRQFFRIGETRNLIQGKKIKP
jgi:hypothetical protein